MTTTDERRAMITILRSFPTTVEAAVGDLTDAQLDTLGGEGLWTVRQEVHHMADSHMNAFIRTKLILTEDHPTLKPYDQDAWVQLADTASAPIQAALAILKGVHARWCLLLDSLPDSSWGRSARHPEIGEVTLDDILKTYSRHGAEHLGQITRLRAEKGG
jgi:uncharacterized damage-inducible protein DinB